VQCASAAKATLSGSCAKQTTAAARISFFQAARPRGPHQAAASSASFTRRALLTITAMAPKGNSREGNKKRGKTKGVLEE